MRKYWYTWTMIAAMAMGVSVGHAETKGDPAAGEGKAGLCFGCHGQGGNSEDATFPRLAGQYANYIFKQIKDFQKGLRTNNETMAGMAATIATDEDARDLGAFFSTQKMAKQPLTDIDKKLAAAGEKLFYEGNPKNNVYGCVNCHGERGKGKAATISQFPIIGGQHRDYIVKELSDFRAGNRSNDPAGMMGNIAKGLSDEEIKAVATYLSSQL